MQLTWQRFGIVTFTGPLLFLSATILSASLGSSCTNTTAEKRVTYATHIVAADAVDAPIVNAYGWSIVLTKAALSIGPLYYWNGSPAFAAIKPKNDVRFFGIRSAYAHPGHYVAGDAMGEMLTPSSFDLALGEATLPSGEGVSGVYRSARFTFADKPVGDAVETLGGHVVVLEGEGTKDSMPRLFRAELDVADMLDASGEPRVEGCAFDGEPDVQADGTITIRVVMSLWLDQVELDTIPESADGKPVLLPRDSAPFRAVQRGVRKAAALQFQYSTP